MKKIITILLLILSLQLSAQCWQKAEAGFYHTLGVKADGTLWAWGLNDVGQLGNGTNTNTFNPVQIGGENNWQSVAVGFNHSLAIKTDGTLWAWGRNETGQLGDGTAIDKNTPIQIGTAANWQSVTAGSNYSIAIKTDGTLWAWGANTLNGNLGDGTLINKNVPTQIGTDTNWQSVDAFTTHTVAVKTDGSLWTWGYNFNGQLGVGDYEDKHVPTRVGTSNSWATASAGDKFTIALRTSGTMYAFGRNSDGQLGDNSYAQHASPVQILSHVFESVAAGSNHAIGTKADGTMWAWGNDGLGQLGVASVSTDVGTPTQVGTGVEWQLISAGNFYSTGIKSTGGLYVWGSNNYGQLGFGDGTDTVRLTPSGVGCPTSLGVNDLVASTMVIFPNPVNNILNVTSDNAITSASIYNVLGQEVISKSLNANEGQIDVSGLHSGSYFVKVNANNSVKTFKVIKE
ncbi:MAG TPA: T9SS type A sorting domain-containing protein [Flavobacterium sp.]|nr:T9SS type A sorting domain-containing protein [Flavobacterium sp.]